MKLDPDLAPLAKINPKWIKNLNIKPDTIKFLEENIKKKLLDVGLGNNFFDMTPKPQVIKEKNQQVGLHQTKKLLHSKGNHKQDQKTTLRMGENICKWSNWQRINLQDLQAAHAAQ